VLLVRCQIEISKYGILGHKWLAAIALFLLVSSPAYAVRPFITDDARIVGKNLGQIETWVRVDNGSFQHWFLPAYGPTDWLEVTAGGYHGFVNQLYSAAGPLIQGKALLRAANSNEFPGLAVAAGTVLSGGFGPFRISQISPYFYAAITHNVNKEKLLTHFNLGAVHTSRTLATWGIGQQVHLFDGLHGVWEVISGDPYAEKDTSGAIQLGFRYIVSQSVQLDATFGTGLWGVSRLPNWGSAGFRWVFG
jgi:hypothetical protein